MSPGGHGLRMSLRREHGSTGEHRSLEPLDETGGPPDDSVGIDRFAASRRGFLASAGLGFGALMVTGAPPAKAAGVTVVNHAFNGVAAFVLPGNDAYSRRQGVYTDKPGGVEAQAGKVVVETLDRAIPIQLSETALPAPGALGFALILQGLAIQANPLSVVGPFQSAFANLTFLQKRGVLERLDALPGIRGSAVGYAGNAIITLAGLGAFSERGKFDRRTGVLSGRPIGWDRSNYGGRSDGHAEFIGYFQDRTEVQG